MEDEVKEELMEESVREELAQEVIELFRSPLSKEELREKLSGYHESDIADALEELTEEERKSLYPVLDPDMMSEVFAYMEDADEYISEMKLEDAAKIIENMDADDAVDILEEMDEDIEEKIVELMDEESSEDIKLIQSYDEDQVGAKMTTNYIEIEKGLTVKQAMKSLIEQAPENDNIQTIYVKDEEGYFYGAIDLKDLIIARENTDLNHIIMTSYPTVYDHEYIEDLLVELTDYVEDSFPVLDSSNHLIGILTSQDLVEAVDEELGDDYAKLGGLSAEEDLEESTFESVKKRLPWLIVLLFLGMGVSSVVGMFEQVVDVLPIVICFQSLILDMAGNVGTQSLAVTIRVLMDENLTGSQKLKLVFKEVRVGICNGSILGTLALVFITGYVMIAKAKPFAFALGIAVCVGLALIIAMLISSLVGTLVPLIFNKLNIDPAVASGPLITTVNDLVAVVSYYSLAWVLLIEILKFV